MLGRRERTTTPELYDEISDLQVGMILEGVVSNVANFGAFVDIGVHQDGLVHISALSNKFVQDPREVVKAGDVVKVKVLEVDAARKTHRADPCVLDDEPGSAAQKATGRLKPDIKNAVTANPNATSVPQPIQQWRMRLRS